MSNDSFKLLTEAQQEVARLTAQLADRTRERDAYWEQLTEIDVQTGTGVVAKAVYDECWKRAEAAEQQLAEAQQELEEARHTLAASASHGEGSGHQVLAPMPDAANHRVCPVCKAEAPRNGIVDDADLTSIVVCGACCEWIADFFGRERATLRADAAGTELVALRQQLADRTRALEEARETNTRLNRRCQIAEAAANTKVEDAEKRSTRGIRAYIFELGRRHGQREAAATVADLRTVANFARGYSKSTLSNVGEAILRLDRYADELEALAAVSPIPRVTPPPQEKENKEDHTR